jgi:hypothetical protein
MTKLLQNLGLVIMLATAGTLAGCDLYFGKDPNGSGAGSGGGGGGGSGFGCSSNTDCAAGCFCDKGTCEEGGFCSKDEDCGTGFHCDTARSSCEPDGQCTNDAECNQGSFCDNGTCSTTICTCANDQDAVGKGFGWCDETRMTCMPGQDPAGTCVGDLAETCTAKPPVCQEHEVPLIKAGCYTDACRKIAECEAAPLCSHLQHEDDCSASTQCSAVFTAQNCVNTQTGDSCTAGQTNCKCDLGPFIGCTDKTAGSGATVIVTPAGMVNASAVLR